MSPSWLVGTVNLRKMCCAARINAVVEPSRITLRYSESGLRQHDLHVHHSSESLQPLKLLIMGLTEHLSGVAVVIGSGMPLIQPMHPSRPHI